MRHGESGPGENLPSHYPYVAEDVISLCRPRAGVWLDVGAGPGGLGLALAARSPQSVVVLLDPSTDALGSALAAAGEQGLEPRTVTVVGRAEDMPLPDASVDLAVSRGSIFFWDDPVQGLNEVHRVLRPGGKAMVGGGLGAGYPAWARREFIRRRHEGVRKKGPEAVRRFRELREPQTFRRWAEDAGLADFQVEGEGGLPASDPRAGLGIWLRFGKESTQP
ncbi:MAG: class I SAM-dependent methyltransferase [bacterium]